MRRDDIGSLAPLGDLPPHLALGAREAHVHVLRSDVFAGLSEAELTLRYGQLLSPAECDKQRRFVFEDKRREYLLTRTFVRTVLSRYARVDRRDWRFAANRHGRPFIANPAIATPLEFNISNTQGFIVCLVATIPQVGIDAEFKSRPTRFLEIADRFFSPGEAAALKQLPTAAQRDRFYIYWTLKEAFLKARGGGLNISLDSFSFDLDQPEIALTFARGVEDEASAWQFAHWALSEEHTCAAALRIDSAPRFVIRQFEAPPPPVA
jgi:4'-phosphopantetheinyl transferase